MLKGAVRCFDILDQRPGVILNIMQEVVGGFNHELKGNICYIKRDAKK